MRLNKGLTESIAILLLDAIDTLLGANFESHKYSSSLLQELTMYIHVMWTDTGTCIKNVLTWNCAR